MTLQYDQYGVPIKPTAPRPHCLCGEPVGDNGKPACWCNAVDAVFYGFAAPVAFIGFFIVVFLAGCSTIIPEPGASTWQLEQARAVGPMVATLAAIAGNSPAPAPPGPSPVPPLPEAAFKEMQYLKETNRKLIEERNREAAQVERVQRDWKEDRDRLAKLTEENEALKAKPKEVVAKVGPTEVMPPPKANAVHWLSSNLDAVEQARETGKPVLIWFTMRNCIWCERVEKQIFSDAGVAEFINENFIALKCHKEQQSRKTLDEWQVDGYPSFRAVRSDWTDWQKLDMTLQPSKWLDSLDGVVAWNVAPRARRASKVINAGYGPTYDDSCMGGSCSSGSCSGGSCSMGYGGGMSCSGGSCSGGSCSGGGCSSGSCSGGGGRGFFGW